MSSAAAYGVYAEERCDTMMLGEGGFYGSPRVNSGGRLAQSFEPRIADSPHGVRST